MILEILMAKQPLFLFEHLLSKFYNKPVFYHQEEKLSLSICRKDNIGHHIKPDLPFEEELLAKACCSTDIITRPGTRNAV